MDKKKVGKLKQKAVEHVLEQVVGVKKMCDVCFKFSGLKRSEVKIVHYKKCVDGIAK